MLPLTLVVAFIAGYFVPPLIRRFLVRFQPKPSREAIHYEILRFDALLQHGEKPIWVDNAFTASLNGLGEDGYIVCGIIGNAIIFYRRSTRTALVPEANEDSDI